MADVQANAPEFDATRRKARPEGEAKGPDRLTIETPSPEQLGDTAQDASRVFVEGERRSFGEGIQTADAAARSGLDAARDVARQYADATKRIADDSRRTTFEVASLWREGLTPVIAAQLDMQRSMEQLWRMATGLDLMPSMRTAQPFASFSAAPLFGLPATDVKETERAYQLSAELPGLRQDDVELEIDGDMLVLRGHKAQAREDARAAFRLSERVFGQFERSFPLPPDADRSGIQAKFHDGLLQIEVPKQSANMHQTSPVQIQA